MTPSAEPRAPSTSPTPRRAGTIDRVPSGSWRVRFRTPDGKRRSKTFRSPDEAELFRAGCERLYGDQPSLTLAGYAEDWFEARELSGAYRSVHNERSVWRAHVEGTDLAAMPLKSIARRSVRAWLAALKAKRALQPIGPGKLRPTERPLSASVVQKALILVRGVLAAALDEELIELNPAADVRPGRGALPTRQAWTYLTLAEIEQLRTCPAIPEWARLLHTFLVHTGLRAGEAWNLHWADVHLDAARPEVVVRFGHKGPPKNGLVRHVPLLAPAREALQRWKEIAPKHADDLVFHNAAGERRPRGDDAGWSPEVSRRRKGNRANTTRKPGWPELAGITRKVRLHDTRHTTASHLLMGSWGRVWRLEEVRDLLGHSSIKQTQRYAHLSPEHLANAAAATPGATPSEAPLGSGLGHEPKAETLNALETSPIVTLAPPSPSQRAGEEDALSFRDVTSDPDPLVTQSTARALLMAAASGEAVPVAMVDGLIAAVLSRDPLVAMALEAREEGPHRLMRALRLAAAVCEASRAAGGATGTNGGAR